jgi:hypothetical protein
MGTVPSFALWRDATCFLSLSMISWGQLYVTERFCDFLLRHNLLIKLQPWLTFLWTTFCPFFLKNNSYYNLFFSYDKLLIFLYFRVCPSRIKRIGWLLIGLNQSSSSNVAQIYFLSIKTGFMILMWKWVWFII